jgi:Fe-S-cluster containining protein
MKFKCQMCEDSCCKKKIVALTKADVIRLSKVADPFNFIDFVPPEYNPKGRVVHGNSHKGVMVLKHKNEQCVFLKDNKCSVHKHRPLPCRMYPCNPIFAEKKDGFTMCIAEDQTCPGIGKGKEFPIKALALQWRKERKEYDQIVLDWNIREDRHLGKFIGELLLH